METFRISYSELADILIDYKFDITSCLSVIATQCDNLSASELETIRVYILQTFCPMLKTRWNKASRTRTHFVKYNEGWLSTVYEISKYVSDDNIPGCSTSRKVGRPIKTCEEAGTRAKRAKLSNLRAMVDNGLLKSAAQQAQENLPFKRFSPEKALSLMLDASLSKYQYEVLRNAAKEVGCDIFPAYYQVVACKKQCIPKNVTVEETFSQVHLQDLLDHTAERILLAKSKEEVNDMPTNMKLVCKWGCDGSSGHSNYKQSFTDETMSDSSMFLTSLVPLMLVKDDDESVVCWKNPRPSSTRFCRPIKFQFVKETPEVVKQEVNRVETEMKNLSETISHVHNKSVRIKHSLLFTMIDGKVASIVTDTTSMAVCMICKAKPSQMNQLNLIRAKPESEDALKLGMSPLHARIKFMECILHIAYNKSFATWRTNKNTQNQKEETKKEIQAKLKLILGINVDVVKQGMGTTNDGNTSRRFFEDPAVTADIVGVDEELIRRFSIILKTINSNLSINAINFGTYCSETADIFVNLYPWYYMPVSVHKILIHGSKIVAAAVLPIGMLSEEAQEARNKDYRKYRFSHARKCSRIATNKDVMGLLLVSSDPLINTIRQTTKTKNFDVPEEMRNLIIE